MRRDRLAFRLVMLGSLAACAPDAELPAGPPVQASIGPAVATPVQIFGAWHCGNDYCTWGSERAMAEFDQQNRWLVYRIAGSQTGLPSVNLVVLSFVHPLKLLQGTTDATTLNGVPRGMTPDIVNYFTSRGIRVMLSIGGITYVDAWNQALASNPTRLGLNAAEVAGRLGVGIEIDYEENTNPNLAGLQAFIDAYRSVHPYDATGEDHPARLTIDLAAGDRWLIALTREATAKWLAASHPVLDYANAMVPARQPTASDAIANWQEHVDGKPRYGPPILPLAPAKFTGGLYVAKGGKPLPECIAYDKSLQRATGSFVQGVLPHASMAGASPGMLGFMFWAAERPAVRGIGTVPPYTCEGGMGAGATALSVPIPMPPLRQQ